MDVREKLYTLFQDCNNPSWKWFPNNAEMLKLIDYLIAHGVTVQEEAKLYWKPVKPGELNLTCSACDSHLGCKKTQASVLSVVQSLSTQKQLFPNRRKENDYGMYVR